MTTEDLEASPSERSPLIVSTTTRTTRFDTRDSHEEEEDNHHQVEDEIERVSSNDKKRQRRKMTGSARMVAVPLLVVLLVLVFVGVVNKSDTYRATSPTLWIGGISVINGKSLYAIDTPLFSSDDNTTTSSSTDTTTDTTTDENDDVTTTISTTADTDKADDHLSRQLRDKIASLPGLNYDPGFDMYSGYFAVDPVNETRHLFYWYVESQGDPANDPVMFWTNGGPGCSGLYAFAVEHGPFFFTAGGELFDNPYSWNKAANILYVEIPIGVGFSYSTQPEKDYNGWGDVGTAIDNLELIKQFFLRFPERRSNDFYISSESYGGHYMPQLTKEILLYNRKVTNSDDDDERINFKGTLVGNPYVDPYTNDLTQFQTWYDHGLLPWPLYQRFVRNCVNAEHHFDEKCLDLMDMMYSEVGKGISPYGLDFPVCLESKFTANTPSKGYDEYTYYAEVKEDHKVRKRRLLDVTVAAVDGATEKMTTIRSGFMDPRSTFSNQTIQLLNRTKASYRSASNDNFAPLTKPEEDFFLPCQSNHLSAYMNRPDVVKAVHANPDTLPWRDCSHRLKYSYKDHVSPQKELYAELLRMMKDDPFHFLVFSGDDDSVCSLAGTQAWIWDIGAGFEEKNSWNPWYVDGQTAGYVTQFDVMLSKEQQNQTRRVEAEAGERESSFTLVTVHGAGHEVPAYRPKEALVMLIDFFEGTWQL